MPAHNTTKGDVMRDTKTNKSANGSKKTTTNGKSNSKSTKNCK